MAPSAITPPHGVQETAKLTAAAVAQKIAQTAPELTKYVGSSIATPDSLTWQ
jgi:branched-chain amino acid aminotransferase